MEGIHEAQSWSKLKVWGKFTTCYTLHITPRWNSGIYKMLLPHSLLLVQGDWHISKCGHWRKRQTSTVRTHCFLGDYNKAQHVTSQLHDWILPARESSTFKPTSWQGTWTIGENHFPLLPFQVPFSLRDISMQCSKCNTLFSQRLFQPPWTSLHAGDWAVVHLLHWGKKGVLSGRSAHHFYFFPDYLHTWVAVLTRTFQVTFRS